MEDSQARKVIEALRWNNKSVEGEESVTQVLTAALSWPDKIKALKAQLAKSKEIGG